VPLDLSVDTHANECLVQDLLTFEMEMENQSYSEPQQDSWASFHRCAPTLCARLSTCQHPTASHSSGKRARVGLGEVSACRLCMVLGVCACA
jgi:hypothetical protein